MPITEQVILYLLALSLAMLVTGRVWRIWEPHSGAHVSRSEPISLPPSPEYGSMILSEERRWYGADEPSHVHEREAEPLRSTGGYVPELAPEVLEEQAPQLPHDVTATRGGESDALDGLNGVRHHEDAWLPERGLTGGARTPWAESRATTESPGPASAEPVAPASAGPGDRNERNDDGDLLRAVDEPERAAPLGGPVPEPGRGGVLPVPGDRLPAAGDRQERAPDAYGIPVPVAETRPNDLLSLMSDQDFWAACRFELRRLVFESHEPFSLPAWTRKQVAA